MIVDANVVTYWLVETPLSTAARKLLARSDLMAPSLIRIEVASVLLKFLRSTLISRQQLAFAMEHMDRAVSEFVDDNSLLERAIDISVSTDHKIYDCLYLALALERNETVATADKRLAVLANSLSIQTELIEPAS